MKEIRDNNDLQKRLQHLPPVHREKAKELIASGRKLWAVGFWTSDSDHDFPHPGIFQDDQWNATEKEMVIDYLRNGRKVMTYLGLSWCRFHCGENNMGSCDYSDGIYCWPEGLVHYVEKHELRLPDEFVEHVRKNQHRSSFPEDDAELQLLAFIAPDFTWWKSQKGLKKF